MPYISENPNAPMVLNKKKKHINFFCRIKYCNHDLTSIEAYKQRDCSGKE